MKTLQLPSGLQVKIDDEDLDLISKYRWYASKNRNFFYARSDKPRVMMHKVILNAPKGIHVDHINGDTLDNRKENLRICSIAENQWNRGKSRNNTSGYKGVCWHKGNNKWIANITVNKKTINLGSFDSPELAYNAYCESAKKLHGDFYNIRLLSMSAFPCRTEQPK